MNPTIFSSAPNMMRRGGSCLSVSGYACLLRARLSRARRTSQRLIASLVLLSCFAWAQSQSGSIVGTVTDAGGAVVPSVKVTLTNQGTHFTRAVSSNQSGQYVAYSIPTGRYSIEAEAAGFERMVLAGIELTAADTVTVDIRLVIGSVQQTMEVTAEAPLLQSQTAAVSQLISNRQVQEMPLNGRTFTALLLLTPGVHEGSSNNLRTSPYAMRGSANYSVNGSSAQMNSYLIDGIVNRNLWLNTLIMVPTIDAIQEFRVMTSNYSAEYGASAGAVTVVQTKSGSNELHGSAYEFLRNDRMDANTFFNNRLGAPKPPFRRNEFGATAGGAVRRDKIFFFGDYQGIRIRQPQTLTSTIPTLADRDMVNSGDFSGLGTAIFDPLSARAAGGGNVVRDQFSGNHIPPSRLDPASLRLFQLLPAPTSSAATRNFIFDPVLSQRTDQFDIRADLNLGKSDRFFAKYSYDDTSLIQPGVLPAPSNAGIPIGPYLSADGGASATSVPLRNQSLALNYVVFGPSVVNEARAGVVRWNQHILPLGNGFNTATAIGIPGININDKSGGLPAFAISGFRVIGEDSTYPEQSQTASFQFEDILTKIQGSHTLKFGARFVRHRFNGFSAFPTRGQYNFNGQFTRQAGASSSRTALADFALGAPNGVSRNVLDGTFGMRMWEMGAFAEDSWRASNRMTLTYGFRHEIFAPPYDVHNHWANFNVVTGKLLIAGRDGNSRTLRNLDLNNFGPRFGLTYLLTSDSKTVLRSGFGVSYADPAKGGGQLYKNLPFYFSQVISTDQNGVPALLLHQGLPAPVRPDLNNPAEISSGNPNAWDFNLQATRVMQWSMGIQRELPRDLLLDIAYVGNRTTGLNVSYNINQTLPGPGPQQSRRPLYAVNPLAGNVTYQTNYASSRYNALQVRVVKRYSAGLSLSTAYTWSKYLSNGGNINSGGNAPPQDARCFRCERGNMQGDARAHVLVINHEYELPFGARRRWVHKGPLAQVIGNWTVTGIWSASTGDFFTPTLAAGVSNSAGGGGDRPNRVRDGNLPSGARSIDHWFDLAAFVAQPQYTFGSAGRGILVGPGVFNADLGIHRKFLFTEQRYASLRWEMFNALNRANFSSPNSSIGSALAGQISSTAPARIMQVALKLIF